MGPVRAVPGTRPAAGPMAQPLPVQRFVRAHRHEVMTAEDRQCLGAMLPARPRRTRAAVSRPPPTVPKGEPDIRAVGLSTLARARR